MKIERASSEALISRFFRGDAGWSVGKACVTYASIWFFGAALLTFAHAVTGGQYEDEPVRLFRFILDEPLPPKIQRELPNTAPEDQDHIPAIGPAARMNDINTRAPLAPAATGSIPRNEVRSAVETESVTASVNPSEATGSLPTFLWPVRGKVIASYRAITNGKPNDGINLAVPEGTPVKAAQDGVVAYSGNELKSYGNLVLVRHSNGYVTAYAHLSERLVKSGDTITRGQLIAKSGRSGEVTSPQLHFEIRKGSTSIDPLQFLSGS